MVGESEPLDSHDCVGSFVEGLFVGVGDRSGFPDGCVTGVLYRYSLPKLLKFFSFFLKLYPINQVGFPL